MQMPKSFSPRKLSVALLSAGIIGTAGLSGLYFQDATAAAGTTPAVTAGAAAQQNPPANVPDFAAITEAQWRGGGQHHRDRHHQGRDERCGAAWSRQQPG